jgi:hypothetical protein
MIYEHKIRSDLLKLRAMLQKSLKKQGLKAISRSSRHPHILRCKKV